MTETTERYSAIHRVCLIEIRLEKCAYGKLRQGSKIGFSNYLLHVTKVRLETNLPYRGFDKCRGETANHELYGSNKAHYHHNTCHEQHHGVSTYPCSWVGFLRGLVAIIGIDC